MTAAIQNPVVCIVAPIGRDAELLQKFLQESGVTATTACRSLIGMTDEERDGTGAFLIAEEALTDDLIRDLSQGLKQQPAWSDLPFLLMAARSGTRASERQRELQYRSLGNLTVLDRPLRPASLLSAVKSALLARHRQYEIREATESLREAYAALRMSEQRNRLMLESTHDCIKLLDLEGNLLSINVEGQKRLGIADFSTVCGASWLAFWKGPDAAASRAAVDSALAGKAATFEAQYDLPDGERTWWDICVTPVRDDSGSIINLLAVSREITHRKLTETALIQSEKLAAVGRLVSSISHEINNPLEAVTNLVYIALQDARLHPEIQPVLATADEELRRASQIVSQTLLFQRQSTLAKRSNTRELVDSVVQLYRSRLMNCQIKVLRKDAPGTSVLCLEGEVRQVLSNLIGNAIDAMRGGGTLFLRTRSCTSWGSGEPGVCVIVADTGSGMESAVARRIFEAFFTTKGDNGTGLGLWICKGMVDKHGGSLKLRSRPKAGTVFRLFMPAQPAFAKAVLPLPQRQDTATIQPPSQSSRMRA